jgi:NAD(P)-dependent dehydrogenase (short-subunit alcohol dehydrogenase family)
MAQRVWLITGCSTGLGKAIATAVIASGDQVVVTARKRSTVDALAALAPDRALAFALDIAEEAAVARAVDAALARFGRIDVLVNNAGTGLVGALEECTTQEARDLYEVNFFGTLAVTRRVLPTLRQQRSGHIIFVTSAGAITNFPGASIYGSSKAALESVAESLRAEVAPLGIRVTCLVPGLFRTDFRTRSLSQARCIIDDYRPILDPLRNRGDDPYPASAGDPGSVGEAIIRLAALPEPPFRVPLGADAMRALEAKIKQLQGERPGPS